MSDLLKYQITKMNGGTHITAYLGEESRPAGQDHPYFTRIKDALVNDNPEKLSDEAIFDLFNIPKSLKKEFEKLSSRVAVEYGKIFYKGEPIDNALCTEILKRIDKNEPFGPLVNFFERLMRNPIPASTQELYGWIEKHGLDLTDEGKIIGWKSCNTDEAGEIVSTRGGGEAIVTDKDGKARKVSGVIPQLIGGSVEMPFSRVDENTRIACSTGLHVGSKDYAMGFTGNRKLKVLVDPEDVVSVPSNGSENKMRVWRYEIVEEVNTDGTPKNAPAPLPASSVGVNDDRRWWNKR